MAKTDFGFHHDFRIRYSEIDAQGIVFFGNYMAYFDSAHTEYLRAMGFKYDDYIEQHGADFHIVRVEADYLAPARFDEVIEIYVRTAYIGRSSMRVAFEVYRAGDDTLLVFARTVLVNADRQHMRPAPWPTEMIDLIAAHEVVPVERPATPTSAPS